MKYFGVLCLCLSVVWASPLQESSAKAVPLKNISSRIINGDKAVLGQFPWQAALRVTGNSRNWFCGGSIISEEWILTAGHCVSGGLSAIIETGLVDLDGNIGLESTSSDLVLHEGYDIDTLSNDIGLIKLSKPLQFDENTAAISLSSEPLSEDEEVTVSGWGLTSDGGTAVSPVLNYVKLVTIANSDCEKTFGSIIHDTTLCAVSDANPVKSPCNGDSGGPVVINVDSNPEHVAIASFVSDSGCESDNPSGYTRTAPYRDWIREKTGV
jgi:secreted trypsin-like serine protease